MKLAELQQAVRAADPAAILVSPRVLNRLIQEVGKLPSFLWEVPHRRCFVLDRHVLFRHVEQEELELEPDRLLPQRVVLLALPNPETLASEKPEDTLLKYWRRLFHASLHLALEKNWGEGLLSPEEIRKRIDEIGSAEFEEIRLVLTQDHYLASNADDQAVYIEFVSVYLELRYFAANLLPTYFPAIRDFQKIDRLLARDVDAGALFTQTRLAGAPDPVVRTDNQADESNDYYWRLIRHCDRANRQGNTVRAAILRMRAARVAPASLTLSTRVGAEADLQRLTARLQVALQLTNGEVTEWLKDLPALLEKADQGSRPVEAALLYDLQKVCLENERDIYALDVVEWVLSGGKRPIKRPLPSQRMVRITKHLRSAAQRLTRARLNDADRQHLAKLLLTAEKASEERLRARLRPILTDAMHDVGLLPANVPERTAFLKMIEELLDRITAFGFLTFSDLRDAISRNQLKLPDPADPQEFIRGDALLRLDRRLAALLDGVYRAGEFYLRFLQRFTTLAFGTSSGRFLTRYVALPFGISYALTEGTEIGLKFFQGQSLTQLGYYSIFLLAGCFLLGLINWPGFRRQLANACIRTGRLAHKLFIDLPGRVIHNQLISEVVGSWTFQLFYWYLFKPAAASALLWWLVPDTRSPLGVATTFLAANFVLNSRPGKALSEGLVGAFVELYELMRGGLFPGLFRLLVSVFKRVIDLMEYVLFSVDEWLQFRSGNNKLLMVAQTILGVLWFPVSYLARFYMIVLIEPGFNPIKAPVSYLAAKITWPIALIVAPQLVEQLEPLGFFLANIIVWPIAWLIPDAFGFLFWEMKENWSLYRANRQPTLKPVSVGLHGETVRQLLQPGFHSGTVPRLYARLRRAEEQGAITGNWGEARLCRRALEEVEQRLERMVARELVTLLDASSHWKDQRLSAGNINLACNRITIELENRTFPAQPARLEWEHHAGWLVAGIPQPGWLDHLQMDQLHTWTIALAGLYKLAGIDLIREQVAAHLPPGVSRYDITSHDLIFWLDQRQEKSVQYNLKDLSGSLNPRAGDGSPVPAWPVLESRQLLFSRVPLTWQEWKESWQNQRNGELPASLTSAGVRLIPDHRTLDGALARLPMSDGVNI
jgi:hypothetical protein